MTHLWTKVRLFFVYFTQTGITFQLFYLSLPRKAENLIFILKLT